MPVVAVYRIFTALLMLMLVAGTGMSVTGMLQHQSWGMPDFDLVFSGLLFEAAATAELLFLAGWRAARGRVAAAVGSLANAIFLIIGQLAIWTPEAFYTYSDSTRMTLFGSAWTIAFTLMCAAAFTRLPGLWQWSRRLYTVILLGVGVCGTLYAATDSTSGDVERAWTISLILGVTGGVIMLVLHHTVGAKRAPRPTTFAALRMPITCPRCTATQTVDAGAAHCYRCGLRFNIEIEEERCPKCHYTVYQITSDRCPECGEPLFTPSAAEPPPSTPAPL